VLEPAARTVADPTVVGAWLALVRSRIAAQASYRSSFALDVAAQVLIGLVEFAEVYIVFTQVNVLGGFSFAEVTLIFGLATAAFGLADLVVGHVDRLPFYVRTGQLDAFLLRPLSALGQLVTSDFSLRRLGRVAISLVLLTVALVAVDVDWNPARVVLLVVTPFIGAVSSARCSSPPQRSGSGSWRAPSSPTRSPTAATTCRAFPSLSSARSSGARSHS